MKRLPFSFAALLMAGLLLSLGCDQAPNPQPYTPPAPQPDRTGVPVAAIDGPTKAVPGEIVELSAKSTAATHYSWAADNPETKLVPRENGRICQVASYAGTHRVRLVVSNAKGNATATHTLTVGCEPLPPPGPQPEPAPPGPKPPEPQPQPQPLGEFASFVLKEGMKVTSATRDQEAKALANQLEAIGSQIAAGTLPNLQDRVDAMRNAMRDATGQKPGWREFQTEVLKELSRRNKSWGTPTNAWFIEHCNEAAKGLRLVTPPRSSGPSGDGR